MTSLVRFFHGWPQRHVLSSGQFRPNINMLICLNSLFGRHRLFWLLLCILFDFFCCCCCCVFAVSCHFSGYAFSWNRLVAWDHISKIFFNYKYVSLAAVLPLRQLLTVTYSRLMMLKVFAINSETHSVIYDLWLTPDEIHICYVINWALWVAEIFIDFG